MFFQYLSFLLEDIETGEAVLDGDAGVDYLFEEVALCDDVLAFLDDKFFEDGSKEDVLGGEFVDVVPEFDFQGVLLEAYGFDGVVQVDVGLLGLPAFHLANPIY